MESKLCWAEQRQTRNEQDFNHIAFEYSKYCRFLFCGLETLGDHTCGYSHQKKGMAFSILWLS